jgi:ribonuclease-3
MPSAMLRRRTTPLERRLGYRFRRPELLARAITHRSFAYERDAGADYAEHYERLEFLGDAVLGLVAAESLYLRHPEMPEGELTKLKSRLVSRPVLARFADELELGEELRLGVGEERSGGRRKASLLADAWEAVVGAVYLDGGLEAAARCVRRQLDAALEQRQEGPTDAKTRLQEEVQARGWSLPAYALLEAAGPDHAKSFTVECRIRGERCGVGQGRSKKRAEQAAAAAALEGLAGRQDD